MDEARLTKAITTMEKAAKVIHDVKGRMDKYDDQVRDGVMNKEQVEQMIKDVLNQQRELFKQDFESIRKAAYTSGDTNAFHQKMLAQGSKPHLADEKGKCPFNTFLNRKATNDTERRIQQLSDDVVILGTLMGAAKAQKNQPFDVVEMMKRLQTYEELKTTIGEYIGKAMDTTTAGEGLEWIPTGYSTELQDLVRLELKVAALFRDIPMPRDPFTLPLKTSKAAAKYVSAENTEPTATLVGTGNITLAVKKLMTYVPFSYELDEDSIVAVMPIIKDELVISLAEAVETAILNGDVSGTHMDSDTTDGEDPRKMWKGIRAFPYLDAANWGVNASNATITAALMRSMRPTMGKYGVNPKYLAWIVGINTYISLLDDADVRTLDKYGPKATVFQGELGKLDGIPIIVSEFIREDLNASGVEDGVTTDRTCAHLVYNPDWLLGTKRPVLVESDKDIKAQTIFLVSSQRKDFIPVRCAATDVTAAWLYNIAKG